MSNEVTVGMAYDIPTLDWSKEEDAELRRLVKKRLSMKRDAGRDLVFANDLLDGEEKERQLASILNGDVEVKTHRGAGKYGSVFIETMQGCNQTGIRTSTADWQAQVLDGEGFNGEVIVLIKTDRLKRIVDRHYHIRGGENSRGAKIKLKDLLETDEQINKRKEIS